MSPRRERDGRPKWAKGSRLRRGRLGLCSCYDHRRFFDVRVGVSAPKGAEMNLEPDQLALLAVLADAQRTSPKGQHEHFITSSTNDGVDIADAAGAIHPLRMSDLTELKRHGLVDLRSNRSGDLVGTVSRAGLQQAAEQKRLMKIVRSHDISNEEREVLAALLRQTINDDAPVAVHGFRREHRDRRQLIDALVAKRWINRDGDFYRVDRDGLLALDNLDSKFELIAAEKVANHMTEVFWQQAGNHTFQVAATAAAIGMSKAAFSRAVQVVADVPGVSAFGGWSGDGNGYIVEVNVNEAVSDITSETLHAPRVEHRGVTTSVLSNGPATSAVFDDLQKFDVGEPIGLGANGAVYEGRDPHLGRDVALKFLNISKEALLGTKAQAAAQAKVQHPNVLPVFALGRARNPQTGAEAECIVMELVRGATTLQDWMGPGNLRLDDALRVSRDVLKGLAAIHAHGLVHGDIHPDNVLLDRSLFVRVIDLHYLEARARGSTATKAWLVECDCGATAMMLKGLLKKTPLNEAALQEFATATRSAQSVDDISAALERIGLKDDLNEVSAPLAQQQSKKLRALLDANRIPALVLSSTGSTRHDHTRRSDYAIAVQQLDNIAIIDAAATGDGEVRALPNLVRRREDGFATSLAFGSTDAATKELCIQLKLNSGEVIRYRFAVRALWGDALTAERLGLSLHGPGGFVETIDD